MKGAIWLILGGIVIVYICYTIAKNWDEKRK